MSSLLHYFLSAEQEWHGPFPLRWIEAFHRLGDVVVVAIIGVENLLDRGWCRRFHPFKNTFPESFSQQDFFANNEPCNFTGAACFRIGPVVGPLLGYPLDDFAGSRSFFLPVLQEQRCFV